MYIPSAIEPLLLQFSFAFTAPAFQRFTGLMLSAILTTGRRTVSNLLRTAPAWLPGHASSCHRVFSQRRWSLWKLGYLLAHAILHYLAPEGTVWDVLTGVKKLAGQRENLTSEQLMVSNVVHGDTTKEKTTATQESNTS